MIRGTELDSLVAEKIFGITQTNGWVDTKAMIEINKGRDGIPKYSQEIEAAMEIIEKMKGKYDINIDISNDSFYTVRFTSFRQSISSYERSLPEAICLTALKVLGVSV